MLQSYGCCAEVARQSQPKLPISQMSGKLRQGLSHSSRLPQLKSCWFYHGIHFPFFGSMSFRGMNLIQPSRLASFLSGTWPM